MAPAQIDLGRMTATSRLSDANEIAGAARATSRRADHGALSWFVAALIDGVIRVVPVLGASRQVLEMLVRYAWVGGVSSILYAACAAIAVSVLKLNHDVATIIAFVLVVPLNFAMHRGFTFRSLGGVHEDLPRYLLLQLTGIIVSVLIMSCSVDLLGWPYPIGIVGSIVLVPLVGFLVMDRWVFARKAI